MHLFLAECNLKCAENGNCGGEKTFSAYVTGKTKILT